MTGVVSLGARRAAGKNDPRDVKPRDLLAMVLEEIDAGKFDPSHIMVISGMTEEDLGTSLRIDQAGKYDRFGQIGVLTNAANIFAANIEKFYE